MCEQCLRLMLILSNGLVTSLGPSCQDSIAFFVYKVESLFSTVFFFNILTLYSFLSAGTHKLITIQIISINF